MQEDYNRKDSCTDGRLDSKGLLGSYGRNPLDLKIGHNEPCRRSREVDPCAYFAATVRIRIELIGADANGRHHGAEDVHTPGKGCQHVVISTLKAETKECQASDQEGQRDPVHDQASFGVKTAFVSLSVDLGCLVVQPVTNNLSNDGSDNGSEKEEAYESLVPQRDRSLEHGC